MNTWGDKMDWLKYLLTYRVLKVEDQRLRNSRSFQLPRPMHLFTPCFFLAHLSVYFRIIVLYVLYKPRKLDLYISRILKPIIYTSCHVISVCIIFWCSSITIPFQVQIKIFVNIASINTFILTFDFWKPTLILICTTNIFISFIPICWKEISICVCFSSFNCILQHTRTSRILRSNSVPI